ncbi:type III-B CRISPR-associated protein Cas10/Cmr2 [Cylindrospermopsis curvispora GIHE-G1]|uniref:Type III-B CRISPR-associated protein Cas10/Cmr2 n=2 Tax=Cylindrospermopsis TaxID=77021 RepID=A0A7H0F0N0_9CYAN|nr:type III-B CRISPR-associated protein Cas10/Cmr2 [Cylindrospermopsis curvispora GIHE-G1]
MIMPESDSPINSTNFYSRKLYALLEDHSILQQWPSIPPGELPEQIASSSDRVNLAQIPGTNINRVKHPISGQSRNITSQSSIPEIPPEIASETDIEKLFWWFWRFYPELIQQNQNDFFLYPAHSILPDCPLYSYKSTVSALVGAMYPPRWQPENKHQHPYLLLFTFSPVQEFIKASRKFLDFWAGSYLLHYLSVKLCWKIAELYGPDAVITPSLWSQEIVDALIIKKYPDFADYFASFQKETDPVGRFHDGVSTSLSTAGFPNVITVLVPGKEAARELGKTLREFLTQEYSAIAQKVRKDVKERTIKFLKDSQNTGKITQILEEFSDNEEIQELCQQDLDKWHKGNDGSCWEWNKLWEAQIDKTWETYWTAVPLGNPDRLLSINPSVENYQQWKQAQNVINPPNFTESIPTTAEEKLYDQINTGTWWGALQARLAQSIQAVKNTRTWAIPTAPGERSTLSGQFSVVHPQLHYHGQFKNGGGLSARSMGLFWRLMAKVYPGLFNGSEKLNAIELTKRMAWRYGGVAESLGINLGEGDDTNYDNLIRFPNLSSIAAARFTYDDFCKGGNKTRSYWGYLNTLIIEDLPDKVKTFASRTRAVAYQIPKVDREINPHNRNGQNFNGVMFSSKWLADDMNCNAQETAKLRGLVQQAHKKAGFGEASPADWWVIVLGDGDGMGKYVSGSKLKNYEEYLITEAIAENVKNHQDYPDLLATKKRMGPATHVGLNRALLDFSNRLVPYLTEKRYCGKVVYSGGDDVMAVLSLADLPGYLRSLRAAWCGGSDPEGEFSTDGGYWTPKKDLQGLQKRPYFTMGDGATMSIGIVIAHKSVPLPTVLESLWSAEKDRAKKLYGKDGLCFRVIYGSGNSSEALMKGELLDLWWDFMQDYEEDLSTLFYRLAEELPLHACITESNHLFRKAAQVIINRPDQTLDSRIQENLLNWLDQWENWAYQTYNQVNQNKTEKQPPLGTTEKDLANLLRFSAFWNEKMMEQVKWGETQQ